MPLTKSVIKKDPYRFIKCKKSSDIMPDDFSL